MQHLQDCLHTRDTCQIVGGGLARLQPNDTAKKREWCEWSLCQQGSTRGPVGDVPHLNTRPCQREGPEPSGILLTPNASSAAHHVLRELRPQRLTPPRRDLAFRDGTRGELTRHRCTQVSQ